MLVATAFARTRALCVVALPALAATLALAVAAPSALAEMRDFSCTGEQLGRAVMTDPTTFQRSAMGPVTQTFTARPQVRRFGAGGPVVVEIDCTSSFDLHHFGGGSGRIGPIDGQYRLRIECVAKPAGGPGARGLEQRLSVPAPASGGPLDPPEMKARFEQAACRSARSAIYAATRSGR